VLDGWQQADLPTTTLQPPLPMEAWPSAPAQAQPTEYWSESQSSCSWATSWAGGTSSADEPATKTAKKSTEGAAGEDVDAVDGSTSGGARSFNRFGYKTQQSVEKTIEAMRKAGCTMPVRFADVAGCDHALAQLRESIELPMKRPKLFSTLGVAPPTGIVLYGPAGCGKSLISAAVAAELKVHTVHINAPELVTDLCGACIAAHCHQCTQPCPPIHLLCPTAGTPPVAWRGLGVMAPAGGLIMQERAS
jgi:hypothetical protein